MASFTGREPPQRVLLLRLSSLGDCLHALPSFHRLRLALPQAELAWVIERPFADLLDGLPGLDRRIVFERQRGLSGLVACWRELRRFRADWALDLQGNGKSQLIAAGSGARWRFGAASDERAEAWPRISPRWQVAPERRRDPGGARRDHAVERGLALLEAWFDRLGLEPGIEANPRLDLALSPAEQARGLARWRALRPDGAATWIVQLAARPDPRSLPIDAWLALFRRARAAGLGLLVSHGPAEAELLANLETQLGPLPRLREPLVPRELAALFHAAAAEGARYLGCDRGPLHLAASAGLPSLVLHGPTDPERTGPYPPAGRAGSPHRALTSPQPLPCRPCLARRCRLRQGPVCLDGLSTQELWTSMQAHRMEQDTQRSAAGAAPESASV